MQHHLLRQEFYCRCQNLLARIDRHHCLDVLYTDSAMCAGGVIRMARAQTSCLACAGTLAHLRDALLVGHADAMLAASIFHFREYTIREAKRFLHEAGITVRMDGQQ